VLKGAKDSLLLSAESNLPSLKRQSEFQQLKDEGQFLHITHWLAISYKKNRSESLRWGWSISKKVGNAVTRNRLKRWGKEFVREFNKNGMDINFIFKIKDKEFYKKLSHHEFDEAFRKVFKKAQ
jgi:ribonuclease P protein component